MREQSKRPKSKGYSLAEKSKFSIFLTPAIGTRFYEAQTFGVPRNAVDASSHEDASQSAPAANQMRCQQGSSVLHRQGQLLPAGSFGQGGEIANSAKFEL